MRKSTGITLLFVLIFLIGVLGFVAYINHSLEDMEEVEVNPVHVEPNPDQNEAKISYL